MDPDAEHSKQIKLVMTFIDGWKYKTVQKTELMSLKVSVVSVELGPEASEAARAELVINQQ